MNMDVSPEQGIAGVKQKRNACAPGKKRVNNTWKRKSPM